MSAYNIDRDRTSARLLLKQMPRIDAATPSTPARQFAAAELDRYLRAILSGPVSDGGAADVPTCAAIAMTVEPGHFNDDEAFEWAARGDTVTIRAGGDLGLVFGVYAFLREVCGCVFAAPGPDGEFIPQAQPMVLNIAPTSRAPECWYRSIQFCSYGDPRLFRGMIDWMAKNGYNYVMYRVGTPDSDHVLRDQVDPQTGHRLNPVAMGPSMFDQDFFDRHLRPEIVRRAMKLDFNHHNLWYWLPPKTYAAEHPEWFSMVDGKRAVNLNQLCICTSNRDAVAELIRRVKSFLRDNPEVHIVGIVPEDGLGMCQCEACVAEDADPRDAFAPLANYLTPAGENRSLSRRYAKLINAVADAVGEEFPSVKVGAMAYVGLVFPPRDMAIRDNVVAQVAVYWRDAARPLADASSPRNVFYWDLIRRWCELAPGRVLLYEYFMGMMAQKSLPYPMVNVIDDDWRSLMKANVKGASVQCMAGCVQSYVLNLTAFARAAWGLPVRAEQLIDDYARGMFGKASQPLADILKRWQRAADALRHALPGEHDPEPLHPTHNALLPDGGNIAYFWHAMGGDIVAEKALASARSLADTPAAARNVEQFAEYLEYCRLAALAMRSRQLALTAPDPRDADKARRDAIETHWPAVIAFMQSNPIDGWTMPRNITRWTSELKALQQQHKPT